MPRYRSWAPFWRDCKQLVSPSSDRDDFQLVTGEVGDGKSFYMRMAGRHLDESFSVDRIHFTQESFLSQAVELDPGSAIVLDEFRGHKRLAMHGVRLEFLDFLKECRGLRLHLLVGFPSAGQMDKDIMNDRVRFWVHCPRLYEVEVRPRHARTVVGKGGEIRTHVSWPDISRLPVPKGLPDPLRKEYNAKKQDRMRDRKARYREAHGTEIQEPMRPRFIDEDAVAAVLKE